MPARLENTIKISIPNIHEEIKMLPNVLCDASGGTKRCRDEFLQCFRRELVYCIDTALRAIEGQVVFSDLQIPSREDGQYIMNFEVFDRSKPRTDSYNWHGQNTSQWMYAGCILYQEGRISTHH